MSDSSKSIAFWGTEPPPLGGMSIHIKRLNLFLLNNGWKTLQYNFTSHEKSQSYVENVPNVFIWYLKLWFSNSPRIHYVISTRAHIRFMASLLRLRGKKIIIRVGGQSMHNQAQKNIFFRLLNTLSVKLCSAFIGVNSEICDLARKYTKKQKIHHVPGFIPPQFLEREAPDIIKKFFNRNALNIVVIGQVFDETQPDIYGLHHLLNSLQLLLNQNFKYKAALIIYGSSKKNFEKNIMRLKDKVDQYGLKDHVLIYINKDELWPIIKECDLFIRPSITDGDANSIREALFFKKTVIASDCVPRPESCILYGTLNSRELASTIQKVDFLKKPMNEEPGNQELINRILLNII